jgi:alpha 1,2-mannosyltransferase
MKWQRKNNGGIFQAYKRSVVDEQHELVEKVNIKMDGGDTSYLADRPDNMRTQWCTEMVDVHARKLDEIVPGFQKTFEDIGGYWMLDEDEDYNS